MQELLSETGIGRALHTVVGQGQLEEVLTAPPEERRRYIEEAAGHREAPPRKERAERKLAGLDQDLLRLQDVLAELQRQLKPLASRPRWRQRTRRSPAKADDLTVQAGRRAICATCCASGNVAADGLGARPRTSVRPRASGLDALDGDVLAAADARAQASTALADAELSFRRTAEDRRRAEQAFREAVEHEGSAREQLASQASRTARIESVDDENRRIEGDLARVAGELEERERELEEAERGFREAEQERHRIEELRRRAGEDAAGRRAESMRWSGRSRRANANANGSRPRSPQCASASARPRPKRSGSRRKIETFDDQSAPMNEKRSALETERRTLVDKELEELDDVRRRHEARRDLLKG